MDLSAFDILIIDDNRHAVEIVRSILNAVGARSVRHASSEEDGFRLFCKEPFDFVIVDQNLGKGEEGLQLVRRIRRDPASRDPFVAIMMLTAYSQRRRVIAARDVGVTEFLMKPFTAAELLRRLQALLLQQRPFIRSEIYFGPDRRRRANAKYAGPEQRLEAAGVLPEKD